MENSNFCNLLYEKQGRDEKFVLDNTEVQDNHAGNFHQSPNEIELAIVITIMIMIGLFMLALALMNSYLNCNRWVPDFYYVGALH